MSEARKRRSRDEAFKRGVPLLALPSSTTAGTRGPLPDKPDSGIRSAAFALVIARSPAGKLTEIALPDRTSVNG